MCGSVDDETKPELLLGEAPSSLSIDLSLSHGPLELLSSMQSHATSLPALTTSLIINCVSGRPNGTGTFHSTSDTGQREKVVLDCLYLCVLGVSETETKKRDSGVSIFCPLWQRCLAASYISPQRQS